MDKHPLPSRLSKVAWFPCWWLALFWSATWGASACRCADPQTPTAGSKGLASTPALALDDALASRFASLSLSCTVREYPNKPSHVYNSDEDLDSPRNTNPAFYGCFDWHSAVHGHWAMARLLKTRPGLAEHADLRARLNLHLTPERLGQELAFFQQERNFLFERPYGWGWLLRLAQELCSFPKDDAEAQAWCEAVKPLAAWFAARTVPYLAHLPTPVREGTHANTAFALSHMVDYAVQEGDRELAGAIASRARDFYGTDRDCPLAYEPSGEDFLSPCLAEADLMRRVLEGPAYQRWVADFLPALAKDQLQVSLHPIPISNPEDPRIGHLIGLWFQRAWCLAGMARALPEHAPALLALATEHRDQALSQMFASGYGGEHWLASFAIHLLTATGLEEP